MYDNIKTKSIDITKFLISLWLKNNKKKMYYSLTSDDNCNIRNINNSEKNSQDLKDIDVGSITKNLTFNQILEDSNEENINHLVKLINNY